jgi:hypothetical protein
MKRTSETRIGQLLALLSDGKPRSTPQAADELHYDAGNLSGAMAVLFERKQVHIVDWVHRANDICGSKKVPVYAFGDGENVPMPPKLSKAEYRAMQSKREMEERERLAEERARPVRPFRHWQDAALFGDHGRAA